MRVGLRCLDVWINLARTGEEAVLLPATSSLAPPEPPRLWAKCCLPRRASWPAWPSVPWQICEVWSFVRGGFDRSNMFFVSCSEYYMNIHELHTWIACFFYNGPWLTCPIHRTPAYCCQFFWGGRRNVAMSSLLGVEEAFDIQVCFVNRCLIQLKKSCQPVKLVCLSSLYAEGSTVLTSFRWDRRTSIRFQSSGERNFPPKMTFFQIFWRLVIFYFFLPQIWIDHVYYNADLRLWATSRENTPRPFADVPSKIRFLEYRGWREKTHGFPWDMKRLKFCWYQVCQLLMFPWWTSLSLRRRTPPSRRLMPCSRRRLSSWGVWNKWYCREFFEEWIGMDTTSQVQGFVPPTNMQTQTEPSRI